MRIKIYGLGKIIFSVALFLSISQNVAAADMSALNFNGDLIGKVIPDGSVINFDNELIGHITADGFVLNGDNSLIGGIVPQGIAISYNNSILGKVNNDGSVTSINDNLVGKVLPNGLVVNDNYDVLGAVVSPGLVYNDLGNIVGRVSGDGRFYNLAGENSGFVTATGYAYGYERNERKVFLAGKLISSKMIVSPRGEFLGSIAPDGKVIDVKKKVIGSIRANGFAYAPDRLVIGHLVEGGYAFSLDGSYMGVVSYNGEVINKGSVVALAVNGRRVINKEGRIIGFTVSMSATANTLDGKYLGRIIEGGKILRGRNQIGKIGVSGHIVDDKGAVIGTLNETGPLFDYLGKIRANASVGGKVVSLEGVDLGVMKSDEAFDSNGKRIGKILPERLIFNNSNEFIGISGVNSILDVNGKTYRISPYGYVFDEAENINGRNFNFGDIYSPEGTVLSYTSGNGKTENGSLNEIARLTGAGIFLDKNDKPLGKIIEDKYATDFSGESLGMINPTNLVVNNQNKAFAKVLPDGGVVNISGRNSQNYGRAGSAPTSISINGDYLGTNSINGQVIKGNEIVGRISSNGYILDNMGALYGTALSMGAIVSSECQFLGVVSDGGEARTNKDAYLGMVLSNGQVVNETEHVIGHVVYPRTVIGKKGISIGVLSPLGTVLNYKNQNLGCLDFNGKVRNAQKEIIGQIIPYMSVMGFDNKIIGYTDFYGNVVDNSGVQNAVIDLDGSIKGKDGRNIGVPFKYTVAFDRNNVYLGRVKVDGNVVSDSGVILGQVRYNGEVITQNGGIGYALYDLYVYDNNGNTVGYIAKNGRVYSVMGEIIGTVYNGFVLDKKQNLIARGARNYEILDAQKQVVGHLKLNGSVVDIKNVEVGKLQPDGRVTDAEDTVIAIADKLQYYQKTVEPESKPESEVENETTENSISSKENFGQSETDELTESEGTQGAVSEMEETVPELTEEEKEIANTKINHKVIGIAVTPGGKYIGDVYSDNKVIDETGTIVGSVGENGEVIDNEGNTVGSVQEQKSENMKNINRQWWEQIAKGVTINPYDRGDEATNVGPGGGIGPGGRYNPKRAAILSQLQEERRRTMTAARVSPGYNAASYTGWQDDWGIDRAVSTLRVNMDNMITADKPIPAVLARSLISLGEAPITAIVERNVYGDSGRNVIIPAGSRVIGGLQTVDVENRFDGSSGGVKLKIFWNRIVRPDGIAFLLSVGKTETGDAQGRGGGALGYVDEQLVKKYTLPIVGTMVSSAITYMMAADEDSTGEVENSKQQAASDARQEFMDKMDQILQEIIDSKSQIQPVTYVPAGTRIIIYPMTDLWLRSTKDIEQNVETKRLDGGDGELVNEVYTDNGGRGNTSRGDGNNGNSSQKVILGNQAQTDNNGGGVSLVEEPQNNPNSPQPRKNIGAIPPPATDGSVMEAPESEEEISGNIDLF